MVTLVFADAMLLVCLAATAQLGITLLFVKEAILTNEGVFCRVKCGLAACLYGSTTALLFWYFVK